MVRRLSWWSEGWGFNRLDAINQHADALEQTESNVESLARVAARQSQQLAQQAEQLSRQSHELVQLHALVLGLTDVMKAKAPFEDGELELAVKKAWTELTAPPAEVAPPVEPGPQTDPYRNLPAPAAPPAPTVTCMKCHRDVPATTTDITEDGPVCDRCSAR